jgi:hypothetical protein
MPVVDGEPGLEVMFGQHLAGDPLASRAATSVPAYRKTWQPPALTAMWCPIRRRASSATLCPRNISLARPACIWSGKEMVTRQSS